MSNPLVTIITPAYNCERFILETIHSVGVQAYEPTDYIVIDDCSTDATWTIVDGFGDMLKAIRHSQNKGEQATVNELLRMVKGKYFMIVNADDPLLPGAIQTLVDFMEAHPDVLCGYPDWDMINEDGSLKMHMRTREYDFAWMVAHHTWIPSVGSIFRSDVIQKIGYRDESFHWLGDGDYWLRLGLVGKMARVPATLACWRYRNGQASGDKSDERAKEHIRVMQKFFTLESVALYAWLCKDQATCWSYLVASVVCKSRRMAISCMVNAVRAYPELLLSPDFYFRVLERAHFVLRRQA